MDRTNRQWGTAEIGLLVLLFVPLISYGAEPATQPIERPPDKWQVSLAPTYTRGNFGTNSTTDFLYVPLTVRRLFQDGDVSLTVPYVRTTSNGTVTLVGGTPNRVNRRGSGGSGSGGSGSGTGGGSGGGSGGSGSGSGSGSGGSGVLDDTVSPLTGQSVLSRQTNSGLGDIVLRGRYYLVDERGFVPTIAVTGRVKFPTADDTKGLGTGQFDEGAGLEVTKSLTENLMLFVDPGYTIIGKPPGLDLRNQWYYDVGLGYYLFNRTLLASVYYEEYRALVSGLQNPRDLLFSLNHKIASAFRLNASVQVGLSNGAPDFGLTGGASYRF